MPAEKVGEKFFEEKKVLLNFIRYIIVEGFF